MAFTDLILAYPRASIITFAVAISFFISLVNYFVLDKERMREIRERQKTLQKEMREHQKSGNHEKMMQIQKEMMPMMMEMMRHSFKPMLITLIPILILFSFLRNTYAATEIASSWFWYYLISALASSLVFRKIFKLP